MPLGHWARGSSSTPARSSLPRAVVTAVSGISLGNHGPAQVSHRPQAAALSSSSDSWRKAIRHAVVRS